MHDIRHVRVSNLVVQLVEELDESYHLSAIVISELETTRNLKSFCKSKKGWPLLNYPRYYAGRNSAMRPTSVVWISKRVQLK